MNKRSILRERGVGKSVEIKNEWEIDTCGRRASNIKPCSELTLLTGEPAGQIACETGFDGCR